MFSHSTRIKPLHLDSYFLRLLPLILLALVLPVTARAQVGSTRDLAGGTGGANTIQGRIYGPSGRAFDGRVRVQLETSERGTLSTVSDDDGSFRFGGLLAGPYTIVVDAGKEYQVLRETVNIERYGQTARSVMVPLYLKLKGDTGGSGGVINAGLAGVPKEAADRYTKGMEAAKKNDGKKAIELLNEAVKLHPQFALALTELGVQYMRAGQFDKAIESLRAALKITPDDVAARLTYGIALQEKKQPVEAEKELREALKKNDASPIGHMYLGMSLISQNRLDEAEKELQRATTLKGGENLALAHRYLGGLYLKKGQLKQAADELELYLKLAPKAPDAERIRGTIQDLRSKS